MAALVPIHGANVGERSGHLEAAALFFLFWCRACFNDPVFVPMPKQDSMKAVYFGRTI